MKVVGLITEYNPFHNGHFYHINEAKRLTNADYVIVVMSGNFVQRGAPAIMNKYSRTKMALACGADIVFELPVCYSTASAEFFALGAVSLLSKLKIVDDLCFGSEHGDITTLSSIANILLKEPYDYKVALNSLVKNGMSYPAARMEAIKSIDPSIDNSILSSPNNILGIEYIKALKRLNSTINPVTIVRKTAEYHADQLTDADCSVISSATAIRKAFYEEKLIQTLEYHVPKPVFDILKEDYLRLFPIFEDDYSILLKYKLIQENTLSLASYSDVTSDLANRIISMNSYGLSFSQLAQAIKSRQWTLTRINRVLTHILLNIKTDNMNTYIQTGITPYARLLGLKSSSSHLLRQIINCETIPVITKMADAPKLISDVGLTMLKEDILASDLYNHVIFNKFGVSVKDEYKHGIVIY